MLYIERVKLVGQPKDFSVALPLRSNLEMTEIKED
jgi:hypothetical protein